jgi:hypothetical protein
MKTKLKLLLTLITPLLLLNCSGKNQPLKTIQAPQASTPVIQDNRGLLGRAIGSPIETVMTHIPVSHESTPYGKSKIVKKTKLSSQIKETSGLIKIDNRLWTFNDSGGRPELYQIDARNGRVVKTIRILNATNYDWEDIAYDDNYVYIGDIGNNLGNRKNLKIYKLPRAGLRTQKSVRAEVIAFSYSDQKEFIAKAHKNNFDCEAMVARNGKLYLFSKNWQDKKTRLYELTTNVGRQVAQYKRTFNIGGFVTGASLNKELDILLLTTYDSLLNVNVWAFTNYGGGLFFDGVAKKLNFDPLLGQVEGVTFIDNYRAYLSSEAFHKYIFSLESSLYELNFSGEF